MNDTAVLITAFTGFSNPQLKNDMTLTLCHHLKQTGHFVCLASHSQINSMTQKCCDVAIYDADNSWQINGVPSRPNHGVAELTSIHNGLDILKRKGFTNVLKLCYDVCPLVNYSSLIERCKETKSRLVTYKNATDLGTLLFFSDIEFFQKTLSMNEIWRFERAIEAGWYDSVMEKECMQYVTGFGYQEYNDFIGLLPDEELHYSHFREDGNLIKPYPFTLNDNART